MSQPATQWKRPPLAGPPVFSREINGKTWLFLDPARLATRDWPIYVWQTFKLDGVTYEVWGECPDGTWWVGRVWEPEITDTKAAERSSDPREAA